MKRVLWSVVAVFALGLSACGPEIAAPEEALGSQQQGLACETGSGACPRGTTCAWMRPDEGLCRPPCVNGTCANGGVCCNQPNGAPYCNSFCY